MTVFKLWNYKSRFVLDAFHYVYLKLKLLAVDLTIGVSEREVIGFIADCGDFRLTKDYNNTSVIFSSSLCDISHIILSFNKNLSTVILSVILSFNENPCILLSSKI